MDCYFSGFCHPRPQPCFQSCPEQPRHFYRDPCPRPCPPENDHLRPPAGVASGQGKQEVIDWRRDVCTDGRRSCSPVTSLGPRHCLGQIAMELVEAPFPHCLPVACNDGCLRFSRHVVEDCRNAQRRPVSRVPTRPVQVGFRPMQMLYVEEHDPCPQKKGLDCDCFKPDGTWKDKNKAPKKDVPIKLVVDYDPCPNKKGPDCDCFNPDGSWRDKSKYKGAVSWPKLEPCVTSSRKCEDDCPECPIEIHSRTVYPKCEAMLPGYGGHVPGVQICKFGKTFGRETREALQKVYSTPLLGRKKC